MTCHFSLGGSRSLLALVWMEHDLQRNPYGQRVLGASADSLGFSVVLPYARHKCDNSYFKQHIQQILTSNNTELIRKIMTSWSCEAHSGLFAFPTTSWESSVLEFKTSLTLFKHLEKLVTDSMMCIMSEMLLQLLTMDSSMSFASNGK